MAEIWNIQSTFKADSNSPDAYEKRLKCYKEVVNIGIIFYIFKLASLFSTNDKIPYGLKFKVV